MLSAGLELDGVGGSNPDHSVIPLLKAPSRCGQPSSHLGGTGIPGACVTLSVPTCTRLLASWEPPGSMPQPCFLPLPVTALPGEDSKSPEEQSLDLSRCYHPSSCRHLLCSQFQTPWLSQPLEKQTHALGACFRTDFPFPL